jgi:aerobic-type carbon monoxide dehydrogenase small subunit (CoxS/CutS family)
MFNGMVVQSCLIPAFRIQGSEVVTIEGFSQNDEYQEIVRGFYHAGVENCGYCDTGKILAVEALLSHKPQPSRGEALAAFTGIKCRCTEPESLADAVLAIADKRQLRSYGRGS